MFSTSAIAELKQKVLDGARKIAPDAIQYRRYLHQHPELSFQEFETSKYLQNWLLEQGVDFTSGFVKTGIVGHLQGSSSNGKTVAMRADFDALPITENSGEDFQSSNVGVMHACGHDVHTACVLGSIQLLQQLKEHWAGKVEVILQPGEEQLPGGASLMIQEGALKLNNPESIIGEHVYPELEAGKIGFKKGLYMASADELHVTVKGIGGHAALPHNLVDPVLIASHIIVALQQIVSRNKPAALPGVLSFGFVEAKGATNVIPNEVKLKGTFRTFNEEWRFEAHKKMKHLAETLAESMGGTCEFNIHVGYPCVVNHEELTAKNIARAQALLGAENVVDLDLRMTAEDFAYFSQIMPSTFYRLGTAFPGKAGEHKLHTPNFRVNEAAIETGIATLTWLTLCELLDLNF